MREYRSEFEELEALFQLVTDFPIDERESVLKAHCPDPILRQRVMAIVMGAELPESAGAFNQSFPFGGSVGPYSLLSLLGAGGLGSVYLAERMLGGVPQRVALKMLAPHAAGPAFVERFYREQHILASLDHPHITRMLDAGITQGGQPYLVMEYVQGEHLDKSCDARNLSIECRVGLMVEVCKAVSYAHRHLIVHLDLKPSNILVSVDGDVKLLDFGTSKLIESGSRSTTTVMATPAFASPEQLRNETVHTACDVYSLGAVMFELLSGQHHAGQSSATVLFERAMKEAEPNPLDAIVTAEAASHRSTTQAEMRRLLRGDLAVIVAKCLRPRPRDRYLSVDALEDDLERYLDGRPVLATPQTAGYRIRKFVRRNRKTVFASAVAAVLLMSSLAYAIVRQHEALLEAERAVRMQNFMSQLFKLANTNYMGKPVATVPDFLRLGVAVLPSMIENPEDRRAGQIGLAESMMFNNDLDDAEKALLPVIAESRAAGDFPNEAEAEAYASMVEYKMNKVAQFKELSTRALSISDHRGVTPATRAWIKIFYTQNRYELGLTTPQDIAIARSAVAEAHESKVSRTELGYALLNLALVTGSSASMAEKQAMAAEAVAIYKQEPWAICETGSAQQVLSYLQQQAGDIHGSVDTSRASWEAYERCRGPEDHDALIYAAYYGLALDEDHREKEALPLLEHANASFEKQFGADDIHSAVMLTALAQAYLAAGRYQDAENTSAHMLRVMQGKANPDSTMYGICHLIWAEALEGEGRLREALDHARIADAAYQAAVSKLPIALANQARAHQLVQDLQSKVGTDSK